MTRVLLLVDDEPDITTLFRRVLKRTFDQVYVAFSSAEANEILARTPVTHVVSDMILGAKEATGTTLIARWRGAYPTIRFAAVFTGRASPKEIVGKPGVDAVFTKPAGFEALVAQLNSAP